MNVIKDEGKISCVKRDDLPPRWVADVAAVKMFAGSFFAALEGVSFHWLPRFEVETVPTHKQFIPYALLQTADGLHTGCYRRSGSETRFHDLWSVSVGGHINPCDSGRGRRFPFGHYQ